MELLAYIKELLLLNDCVIIPGFGGFISNYQPAGVRHSYFTPPGKSVSFNKKLSFNDGMFINYVAGKEGTGYFVARRKISFLVEELNYRLTDGEEVEIPDIGALRLDEHENIIFIPRRVCNLNADAFGLPSFHFPFPGSRTATPLEHDVAEVIFHRRTLKKVFIAASLLLALSVTPLINNNGNMQRSDVMNIGVVMTATPSVVTAEEPVIEDIGQPLETDGEIAVEAAGEQEVTAQEENHRYFLIGGSFREEENAGSYILQMKALGYQARSLGIIRGLNYIAVAGYASFDEACAAQRDFLSKYPDSGIWVYVRR